MKNIFYTQLLLFICLTALLSSCSEDFLDATQLAHSTKKRTTERRMQASRWLLGATSPWMNTGLTKPCGLILGTRFLMMLIKADQMQATV